MTQSIHELRLALRESAKNLEDTENNTNKLRTDFDNQLRKKDEVISMKELIIKEKDAYILKLEEEITKHDPTFITSTDLDDFGASPRQSLLELPSSAKQTRTKRTAISAEPAQHKKPKDLRIVLQAFDKSER